MIRKDGWYKEILKSEGVSAREFATKIGLRYDSFRNLVSRGCPKWIKAFEFGYELGKKKE